MHLSETVTCKNNLRIVVRERGKLVTSREGHNIWLDLGRAYLARFMALASYGPDTPERNDRIKYMGFGIGGTRQIAPAVANAAPLSVAYPGTNTQTDLDPLVTMLERPVRLSGSTTAPADPYSPTDVWLGQLQVPSVHNTPYETTYRRLFTQLEISYSTFTTVPLSEIALFTSVAVPQGQPHNTAVAYDTFDTFSKTGAFELEVEWTIRH
jgi:hypothetical protein